MFDLSKWYADCISDRGDVFIAYVAELQWRKASISYSNCLELRDGQEPRRSYSLMKGERPVVETGRFAWNSPRLGVSGEWNSRVASFRERVFSSEEGSVEWNCLQPIAQARISVQRGPPVEGYGYAENLRLTIAPWRMPIDELRWGRFLSDGEAIVWIDWKGSFCTTIVYRNGARVQADRIADDVIVLGQDRLEFDRGSVLRQGPLGSTALSALGGILLPKRMLRVDECKWRSRVVFHRQGQTEVRGWAIHEVVRWP